MSKHIIHNGLTFFVLLALTISSAAADTYTKVTSAAQLIPGASYLFVKESTQSDANTYANNATLSGTTRGNLGKVAISISDNSFTAPNDAVPFVLEKSDDYYTFNFGGQGYLYHLSNSTNLAFGTSISIIKWAISFEDTQISILSKNQDNSYLRYHSSNGFMVHTNGTKTPIALYVNTGSIHTAAFLQNNNISYWATFSNAANTFIAASDAIVYAVTHNNTDLRLRSLNTQSVNNVIGYVIPANTGVLIKSTHTTQGTSAETIAIPYLTTSETTASSNDAIFATTYNLMRAGQGTQTASNGYTYYKLAYGSYITDSNGEYDLSSLGFYPLQITNNQFTSSVGKAYLVWETTWGAVPARFILEEVTEENTTTAVLAQPEATKTEKFIRNGKIFFRKNGIVYDILGNQISE